MAVFRPVPWDDDQAEDALDAWMTGTTWSIIRGGVVASVLGKLLLSVRGDESRAISNRKVYVVSAGLVLFLVLSNRNVVNLTLKHLRYSRRLIHVMQSVLKLHSQISNEAIDALATMQRHGRVHRTRHYTIYWPADEISQDSTELKHDSKSTPSSKGMTKLVFILFIPGFGVSDVAYAPPSLMLLDRDSHRSSAASTTIDRSSSTRLAAVVVAATDPLRVPSPLLGYTADYFATHVMRPAVERTMERLRQQSPSSSVMSSKDMPVYEWVVMGHSLGGLTAASVALEGKFRRVVLWGPAPYLNFVPHLAAPCSKKEPPEASSAAFPQKILVVQASHDGAVRSLLRAQPAAMEQFWERFPLERTQRVTLQGGTHAGFASYEPVLPEDTGAASVEELLTRLAQQEQAVEATLRFVWED